MPLPRRFIQRLGVVSHASDGTSEVYDLGANFSCNYSVSYFETYQAMPVGACLVAISNLDWGGCCAYSEWHGNTIDFDAPYTVFGYVQSSNSGYQSSYSNISGDTWGCRSEGSPADNISNCTDHYVACTF